MGYPNTTSNKKIEEINKYIKDGWTNKKNHEELREIFNKLILISRNIEKTRVKNSVTFIDTSNDDILNIIKIYKQKQL